MEVMRVRYLLSNVHRLGQSGMLTAPVAPPPGSTVLPNLSIDTPPPPPAASLEPRPLPQPMAEPRAPNPGSPSQMIQPAEYPVVNQAPAAALPEVPTGPQPRWVNEDSNSLVRTLAAAGTVAALAIAGIAFLK